MSHNLSAIGMDSEVLKQDDWVSDQIMTPTRMSPSKRLSMTKSVSIDVDDALVSPDAPLIVPLSEVAVSVQNAYKHYGAGSAPVLKNLSMTVKQGTIYSLLGASGCGKTTLLSCLVGLRKLNRGEIYIWGAKPGTKESGVPGKRVGYMPQELALYGEFSIYESLYFYGRMYSMTAAQIEENITFLIDFLNLPSSSRCVKTLSGGQQRRVSFACSLIHNPELLLLDEPTVGVDALLRQSIWEHLIKLVSTGKTTVIITTHYTEEARQSDQVGVMRNGKLLVEDSPTNLLKQYNTNLLEDIVMSMCLKDSLNNDNNEVVGMNAKKKKHLMSISESYNKIDKDAIKDPPPPPANDSGDEDITRWRKLHRASVVSGERRMSEQRERLNDSYNRILTLTIKNVRNLVRNLVFLGFILLCPALQVVVVCLAIGADPENLGFAVLNNELHPNETCAMRLVPGCPFNDNYTGLLSCQFMELMDKKYMQLKLYRDKETALKDVMDSKVWGLLKFPSNYTPSLKERGMLGAQADLDAVYGSRISLRVDFSNKQIGAEIGKHFYVTLNNLMKNMSLECGTDPILTELPMAYEEPVYGNDQMTFKEYVGPSMLLGILFFFPVTSSGISYITEKRQGTLDRSLVAGVTNTEFIIAYSMVQVVILFCQSSIAFAFLVWVFHISICGPFLLAYGMAILVGCAGICIGFILAALCSSEIQAVLVAIGMFIPNLILAGMVWPLEGLPESLQYFSYCLPCSLACESMRSIVSRGVGMSHSKVYPGFVSTLVWIAVYCIILIFLNKLRSGK